MPKLKYTTDSSLAFRNPTPLDYQVLSTAVSSIDNKIVLKLTEERSETNYMDMVSLWALDMPTGYHAVVNSIARDSAFSASNTLIAVSDTLTSTVNATVYSLGLALFPLALSFFLNQLFTL